MFIIRHMQVEDIKEVQQVAKASWNSTYNGIIPLEIQDKFIASAYCDEMLKRRMERSLLFVSVVNGQIVGFANFSPLKDDGKAELLAIYLLQDFQGNGIGTALLREGINSLKGVREIFINVEKENHIGISFYKAKGFEVVSAFDDDFEGHILKTVRMVLKV